MVLKLDKNGAYQWHTFYSTSATRLAVDASGNVLLGGSDSAAWLGDNNTQPLDPYHGLIDISLVKLSATGQYQWHTFYGTADYNESASGLAARTDGSILLAGSAKVSFQIDGKTLLHDYTGDNSWPNILVMKVTDQPPELKNKTYLAVIRH